MSTKRLFKNVIVKKKTIVPAKPPAELTPTKKVAPVGETNKVLPPGFMDLSFFPVDVLQSPTKVWIEKYFSKNFLLNKILFNSSTR